MVVIVVVVVVVTMSAMTATAMSKINSIAFRGAFEVFCESKSEREQDLTHTPSNN